MRSFRTVALSVVVTAALIALVRNPLGATSDDASVVAKLDEQYQAAVKVNDVAGMDSILASDFVLVVGRGKAFTKSDLLNSARKKDATYEHQEDTQRQVRLYGNTAIVTALLWEKGVEGGKSFDKKLWFSDVYIRTPKGWKYVFAQASLPLP